MRGLIITGTDTGVGKTFVAVQMILTLRDRGVRVGAYKPVVSGSVAGTAGSGWDDLARLQAAVGDDVPIDHISPQRFLAPLAPPVAARLEGRSVDPILLRRGIECWNNSRFSTICCSFKAPSTIRLEGFHRGIAARARSRRDRPVAAVTSGRRVRQSPRH